VLSLAELRRAASAIDEGLRDFRVERIVEPAPHQLALALYGRTPGSDAGRKRTLRLSCDPLFARVEELDQLPRATAQPPAFLQFLRPRLEGARLRGAHLRGDDRQLSLLFEARDGNFELLLSILRKRSNTFVLDAHGTLLAAQRPLGETRRTLRIGAPWHDPPARPAAERNEARVAEDRWADVPDDALLRRIADAYRDSESEREVHDLGARLARALRRERKAAARRAQRIESELAEADRASELQRHGEALKGALGRIEPGAREVRIADPAGGEEVVVPLDPKLSPRQNLEATFKRYQKLVRRLAKAGSQAEQVRHALAALDADIEAVEAARAAGDGEGLRALAERDDLARLLRKHAPEGAKPPELPGAKPAKSPFEGVARRLQPRRYRTRDGLEVWVGRSDEGNDLLSTRLARGKDLFFHLDGAPGSHVVLRTQGRSDPPSESLIDACELAVHFSKAKSSGRADVHVVPIRNVKKPKGAKRALVYVTGGRTAHLRREPARLERLLASRIDD